ncbi:hypothetical protein [Acinetobacter sp. GXMZU3951]
MKNSILILMCICILTACDREIHTIQVEDKTVQSEQIKKPKNIQKPEKNQNLVNNPTPLPNGYTVDITHLKKPMLIDFNGDKKPDAFRVLKNPKKNGMKYLFEFRIADSDQVYFYENDDEGYDLDGFGVFEIAHKGEKFVDMMQLDNADMTPFEEAPQKARIILKNDAITVNVLEDTCATSLFYLKDHKIKRAFLC